MQVRFERVMTRHRERLAAFFVQMHLQPALLHIDVVNPHRERCADLRERKHHQRDPCAVTQPDRHPHIDTVEQLLRFSRVEHWHLALLCGVGRALHRRGGMYGPSWPVTSPSNM